MHKGCRYGFLNKVVKAQGAKGAVIRLLMDQVYLQDYHIHLQLVRVECTSEKGERNLVLELRR